MNNDLRRYRQQEALRLMLSETHLHPSHFIYPLFIEEGKSIKKPVPSMPGIFRYSLDMIHEEIEELLAMNIRTVLLFGIPRNKDEEGSNTWSDDGIVQQSLRYLKKHYPELFLITDVCFCEYTTHGHCGIIHEGHLHHEKTLENLRRQAISHASHGADMLAPSGMIDGMVAAIREALNNSGFRHLPIMSYAVKYASSFYGPFREAANSMPQFGNRKSYQMNPANKREALLEAWADVSQGADILMVKPALPYLDVIHLLREKTALPIAAYQVSGEYAMIKAAAQQQWIDEKQAMIESLLSIKRAGADIIITYFAKDIVKILQDENI